MFHSTYQPPDTSDDRRFEELLNYGIAALKGGDRRGAQRWLNKAVMLRMSDARPWLWLSAATDDPQEQRECLEKAVAADPSNAAARRGLVLLSDQLDRSRLLEEGQGVQPRRPLAPEEAGAEVFLCPQCGGSMAFDLQQEALVCAYCGHSQAHTPQPSGEAAEQVMDYVLPTSRAHRWAEAQQRVACEQCGAVTLLPPEQKADRCPYCGSLRTVTAAEAIELLDPQAIGLMKIDAKQAMRQVRHWLGRGFFSPDDLAVQAGKFQLRPAYYPFWTFDGALEIPWQCEVNTGTSKAPSWQTRSGAEMQLFDDVLVSGLCAIPDKQLAGLEPFNLKELVEFSPSYLAGWPALTYDTPLAEASLNAREKIIQKLQRSIHSTVEPGQEKRELRIGAGKWSGWTFKYVLLPIWVGSYHFRGKVFPLLVNGQTGKVGGAKPRDDLKVFLSATSLFVITAIIAILAILWWLQR
jgi:DNA-directed RNA polymerase subunit RPC12/RpoP